MSLRPVSHGATDVGQRRDHNEDSFLCDEELGLFVVADGMGGHAAGEVASAEAVEQVYSMVKRRYELVAAFKESPDQPKLDAVHRLLESAIQAATYLIFGLGEVEPDQQGMGTTLSALLWGGDRAIVAQVGDSRVYQLRGERARQVTEDHTLVNLQVKMGVITKEQAKNARHGHLITRAVGLKDYVEVDIHDVRAEAGDRFLLCSDGLSDYFRDEAEVARVAGGGDLPSSAKALIDMANSRGGKDNITAVLVHMLPE